jgi:3-oxoacyl-[acyl-carrier protein] reductase
MDLELKNKNALITGSTKGLGFATAKALLVEGSNVVINSRSQENVKKALSNLGGNISNNSLHGIVGDVTDDNFCQSIVEKTVNLLGGLDILITNSGGPPPGSFIELTEKQWDDAIRLSFLSHVNLIRSAIPFLLQSHHPSVLAVTSFTIRKPMENLILSNTIRTATAALIKSLSIELGSKGIRFNSILPGWTHTDRVSDLIEKRSSAKETSIKDEIEEISATIPLGRIGSPFEFARAAAFLVSPAASYINGVMLPVDGGSIESLF